MRVVTIPGFSLNGSSWERVTAMLPQEWDMVELDVPDEGNMRDTVDALAAAGGSGVYAGYSMGGRLALMAAIEHPEVVRGLVAVSATPGIADDGARAERMRTDRELADWIESHSTDAFLERWLAMPMFSHLPRDEAERHRLDDPSVIAGQLRRLGQGMQESLWHRLAEIHVPVRFVVGADDVGYAAIARDAADAIGKHAQVVVIPDAGHALLVETPERVAAVVSDVVNAVSA